MFNMEEIKKEIKNVEVSTQNNSEYNEVLTDMLFFKQDTLSYNGVLLATLLELVFLIFMLGVMDKNYLIGVFIIVNIVFLLNLFSNALQMKVYKKVPAQIIFCFGVYILSRLFTVPFILNVKGNLLLFTLLNVGISILCILSSINCLIKIKRRERFIKEEKISSIQMSK